MPPILAAGGPLPHPGTMPAELVVVHDPELDEVLDLRAMTEIGVPGGKPVPTGG